MKKDIRHLDLNTPDGAQLNMDALYQIAPSAFTIAGTPFVVSQNADIILRRGYNMEIEISRSLWERGRPARALCAAPIRKTNPRTKVTSALPLSPRRLSTTYPRYEKLLYYKL